MTRHLKPAAPLVSTAAPLLLRRLLITVEAHRSNYKRYASRKGSPIARNCRRTEQHRGIRASGMGRNLLRVVNSWTC